MVANQNKSLVAWDFWGVISSGDDPDLIGVNTSLGGLLQQIMDSGGVNIIVSHSSTFEIETFLNMHNLRQYFAKIYGAD